MWTSDPVWDAECYAAEQDRQTDRRPVCDFCGEPIQCVNNNEEYIEGAWE